MTMQTALVAAHLALAEKKSDRSPVTDQRLNSNSQFVKYLRELGGVKVAKKLERK